MTEYQPGQLDQLVTIRRKQLTADDEGGQSVAVADYDTVYASVVRKSGRELLAAERLEARTMYTVVMRARFDLRESDSISWNGRELQIRSGLPCQPRAQYLVLDCELGAAL
jgi:SPP1 family predicted phage head-tail adaptor